VASQSIYENGKEEGLPIRSYLRAWNGKRKQRRPNGLKRPTRIQRVEEWTPLHVAVEGCRNMQEYARKRGAAHECMISPGRLYLSNAD